MRTKGTVTFSPRAGVMIVGVVQLFACLFATGFVKSFNRRTLIIWGHIVMAFVHISVGLFNNIENDIGVLVMILAFICAYQVTSGPVAWLYATETTIDPGLGVCILTLWGVTFILTLICPDLMDKDSLGVSNVFFLFGICSGIGAIYGYIFMKETRGLSDKVKRNIYSPKDKLNMK